MQIKQTKVQYNKVQSSQQSPTSNNQTMLQAPIIPKSTSTMLIQQGLSPDYMNPQKSRFQKTFQSSSLQQSKDQIGQQQEYTKLQQLLQSRQASLREHAKHSHQLKLYIDELEEKNRGLQKSNTQILKQYKTQVIELKQQNDSLRKVVKRFQTQSIDMKRQLNLALAQKSHNKQQNCETSFQRIHSQSVIKVVESQDPRSIRDNIIHSKLLSVTGKESPLLGHFETKKYRINSQSRQKLQVTMKSSRQNNNLEEKQSTQGRNQKHMSTQMYRIENLKERSSKKLIEMKRTHQPIRGKAENVEFKQLFMEKNDKQHHRGFSEPKPQSEQLGKNLKQDQERFMVKNLSRDFNREFSSKKNSSKNDTINEQKQSSSIRKRKNQHQLIRLGHYGQGINMESARK